MLFPLLCNTHASTRRRLHESPSMAAASVSHVPREGPMAGCARLHQATTTPSQGRYINRQDDISTSSSCHDAGAHADSMANQRGRAPIAAGTVLA